MSDEKKAVIRFLMSYTMAEHLGDVGDSIDPLMKAFGIDVGRWSAQEELLDLLEEKGYVDTEEWRVREDT